MGEPIALGCRPRHHDVRVGQTIGHHRAPGSAVSVQQKTEDLSLSPGRCSQTYRSVGSSGRRSSDSICAGWAWHAYIATTFPTSRCHGCRRDQWAGKACTSVQRLGSIMIEENVISPTGAHHRATEELLRNSSLLEGFTTNAKRSTCGKASDSAYSRNAKRRLSMAARIDSNVDSLLTQVKPESVGGPLRLRDCCWRPHHGLSQRRQNSYAADCCDLQPVLFASNLSRSIWTEAAWISTDVLPAYLTELGQDFHIIGKDTYSIVSNVPEGRDLPCARACDAAFCTTPPLGWDATR
jgi:hypothetical protein